MDYVLKNEMDAWSLTDHGHMNGFAEAYLYAEKLKKAGKKFKLIPGCEMYVHPSLDQWRRDKLQAEELAKDSRAAKIAAKKEKEKVKTEIERKGDEDDETVSIETNNALTIENEDETKSGKSFNPVNRRHHLVVLPKTSEALLKIFRLVSRGYLEGFYRFPRIDLQMLREAAKDNDILISSACLGGIYSHEVFSQLRQVSFDKMDASLLDDSALMNSVVGAIGNSFDQYADAVGRHNMMLELQFNRLPAQDVVNRAIIEFARRNSLTNQLLVTADSHYASPDLWYHREMYKKLGYLNFSEYGPDSLPKSKDDVKAELYPKNAEQIWQEFQDAKKRQSFYDDCEDLIFEAIERTHDIAHDVIGDITLDTNYRYPNNIVPKGKTPFQRLLELCKVGMVKRGLVEKEEYVARLKHELEVIKKLDNSSYFVTLARALELARDVCLLGVARGSSGGSLVAYVLEITDLDPIKYECRFDRFMSIHRSGAPDIDCLRSDHMVYTPKGPKLLKNIEVDDLVYDSSSNVKRITFVQHRQQKNNEICYELLTLKDGTYGTVVLSENHRLLTSDSEQIYAKDISVGATLFNEVRVVAKNIITVDSLTDICVNESHTFQVIPFNVVEIEKNQHQYLIHLDTYEHEIQEDFDTGNYRSTVIR
jgi:DNA polymerase III alpha subunit